MYSTKNKAGIQVNLTGSGVKMKNQRIFPGIILIGFGAYFLMQRSNVQLFQDFYSWPTLLLIVGIAFLFQGYGAKDYEAILPGVILAGFGLHFHIVRRLEVWPDHIGTFILIIALGFLLRAQKAGAGFFQGLLFLAISILLLFYDKAEQLLGPLGPGLSSILRFWPAALVLVGLYLLLSKKK
jgi:hypothetical protein